MSCTSLYKELCIVELRYEFCRILWEGRRTNSEDPFTLPWGAIPEKPMSDHLGTLSPDLHTEQLEDLSLFFSPSVNL